ncbi:hypothetical protein IKG28_02840 [Candidatus Saccharibacteria bacterium]|nr:hypothetical protein [Candidatus Saccharibacteria bacterium]
MKRKILSVFLMFTMVMAVVSCNGNATATSEDPMLYSVDDTQPVILEEGISEEIVSEVESEVESETVSETVDKDPLATLEVSEEWARNQKGHYLMRGDRFYTLTGIMDYAKSKEYNVGWRNGYVNGAVVYMSYKIVGSPNASDFRPRYVGRLTIGDIPVISLESGDKIVSFGNTSIELFKVESFTYSINVWDSDGVMYLMTDADYDVSKIPMITSVDMDKFTVSDESGNVVEDVRNLEYGRKYIASGFNGTDYIEKEMIADSGCFVVDREDPIKLDGELDKNGYALYNLSDVPAGLYAVGNGNGGDMYGFLRIE